MRKLEADQLCEYANCNEKATQIAYDRDTGVVLVICTEHAKDVVEYTRYSPEYAVNCPNCDCYFGVN
jgi:translation initiation factor 2 beta subunit (eIF-2beta)/eIF-5